MLKRLRWRVAARRREFAWRVVHWGWREFQRAGLVTADTPAGKAFGAFGRGSIMAFPAGSVYGEAWITVGEDTLIGALVTMSAGLVPGQDLGPDPVLRIGDRCVIGRGSHIVAHAAIEIADDVWTGPYVYVTDQNHGYADPGTPIGRQPPVNRPVSIGAGSWLGAGAIVLPGARIGRNVVVAAGSVVRGEIPDRCVVAGVPARIVREHTESGWSRTATSIAVSTRSLDHPAILVGWAPSGMCDWGFRAGRPIRHVAAASARIVAFSAAERQIRPSGSGGRSRIGMILMSLRCQAGIPATVGWTMCPLATRSSPRTRGTLVGEHHRPSRRARDNR